MLSNLFPLPGDSVQPNLSVLHSSSAATSFSSGVVPLTTLPPVTISTYHISTYLLSVRS